MKKNLLVFVLIFVSVFSVSVFSNPAIYPTDEFYVNDFANVLSSDVEEHIVKVSEQLYGGTEAQIVVVTVNKIENNDIFTYSLDLAREWGIGGAEKNNGCLIFLSIDDRKSYIHVGYGLEGRLTDGKTGKLQDDYLIPYLKENKYDDGIKNLFDAIVLEVYAEYGIASPDDIKPVRPKDSDDIIIWVILGLLVLIFGWAWYDNKYGSSLGRWAGVSGGGSGRDDDDYRSRRGGGSSGSSGGSRGGGGGFGGGGSGRSW